MDLLIDTYGTKIGASGERIVLSFPGSKERKEYPIRKLEKILILRPASLTTHAVQLALKHDIDIAYLGAFGKPVGRIFSSEPKGLASVRKAQLQMSTDDRGIQLAKKIIIAKCKSQIQFLSELGDRYKKDFSKEILQAEAVLENLRNTTITQSTKN
jgi:CRISPR-associated protein Cas1